MRFWNAMNSTATGIVMMAAAPSCTGYRFAEPTAPEASEATPFVSVSRLGLGYDDTPVSRALGFASVAQPLDEVAAAVLDLFGSDEGAHHRLLVPRLVER